MFNSTCWVFPPIYPPAWRNLLVGMDPQYDDCSSSLEIWTKKKHEESVQFIRLSFTEFFLPFWTSFFFLPAWKTFTAISCGNVTSAKIEYVSESNQVYKDGSAITVHCLPGYETNARSTTMFEATCLTNGSWSGLIDCTGKFRPFYFWFFRFDFAHGKMCGKPGVSWCIDVQFQ